MCSTPPLFVVNLDDPPIERWKAILGKYKHPILKAVKSTLPHIDASSLSLFEDLIPQLTKSWNQCYIEELRAITSLLSGFDKSIAMVHTILIHLQYELYAGCTSAAISLPSEDSVPLLVRNMDWEMPALKDLTIDVEFCRGGEPLYKCTTWAGYIGVLTASAAGKFAVSVNHREDFEDEESKGDFLKLLQLQACHPIGFAVREVMETCTTFEQATERFNEVRLLAPTYLIVAGVDPGHCALIVRGEEDLVESSEVRGSVIQANMDHWIEDKKDKAYDEESVKRVRTVDQFLKCTENNSALKSDRRLLHEALTKLFLDRPLKEDDYTIYGTLMCPKTGEYISWIPETPPKPKRKQTSRQKNKNKRRKRR
jgi:hypothetical protein